MGPLQAMSATDVKKLVKSKVIIHDSTNLEARLSYGLNPELIHSSVSGYEVEFYLLPPPQAPYQALSKEKFYEDLKGFVRFKEPKLKTEEGSDDSLLSAILSHLSPAVLDELDKRDFKVLANELRVFGCSLVTHLGKRSFKLAKRIRQSIAKLDADLKTAKHLKRLEKSSRDLQKLLGLSKSFSSQCRSLITDYKSHDLNPQVLKELVQLDEYCSYTLVENLLPLTKLLEDNLEKIASDIFSETATMLRSRLQKEASWFVQSNYFWITADSSAKTREQYLYRRRILKQKMWSRLYLDSRRKPIWSLEKHLAGMIAAGFAAVWAVAANLMIWKYINVAGVSDLKGLFGFNGFVAISAIVFAYVFKDRIKDIGKSHFGLKFFDNFEDLKTKIFYLTESGKKLVMGSIFERVQLVDLDSIPGEVKDLLVRDRDHLRMFSQDHKILSFRKRVVLKRNRRVNESLAVDAIQDIARINVRRLLPSLDNPTEPTYAMGIDGAIDKVSLPKVYYLDMVISIRILTRAKSAAAKGTVEHLRLVMDKRGLSRIEKWE
jgi:hypothetical protein